MNLSEGTIFNTLKKAYDSLEPIEEKIKEELKKSSIAYADETGSKVNGINRWIHSISDDELTFLFPHVNRGKKAIVEAGVIPFFKGILVRDGWASYDRFNHFESAFCCAHLIRELNYLEEATAFKFPRIIKSILIETKNSLESNEGMDQVQQALAHIRYEQAVKEGIKEEGIANPLEFSRCDSLGRKRRSKSFNLLKRLERTNDVLRFLLEENPEIFTNNAAEREIRNLKVKGKVSGGFRSDSGLKFHCRIRGYLSSLKKNNLDIYEALKSIFSLNEIVNPIIP